MNSLPTSFLLHLCPPPSSSHLFCPALNIPPHSTPLNPSHSLSTSPPRPLPSNPIPLVPTRWGIVHTDKFWRENARLVEQDEFKLLKLLIALLGSSDPVRTVLTFLWFLFFISLFLSYALTLCLPKSVYISHTLSHSLSLIHCHTHSLTLSLSPHRPKCVSPYTISESSLDIILTEGWSPVDWKVTAARVMIILFIPLILITLLLLFWYPLLDCIWFIIFSFFIIISFFCFRYIFLFSKKR